MRRKGSLPAQLPQLASLQLSQLSSLPAHLVTHELTKSRVQESPFSEACSNQEISNAKQPFYIQITLSATKKYTQIVFFCV